MQWCHQSQRMLVYAPRNMLATARHGHGCRLTHPARRSTARSPPPPIYRHINDIDKLQGAHETSKTTCRSLTYSQLLVAWLSIHDEPRCTCSPTCMRYSCPDWRLHQPWLKLLLGCCVKMRVPPEAVHPTQVEPDALIDGIYISTAIGRMQFCMRSGRLSGT